MSGQKGRGSQRPAGPTRFSTRGPARGTGRAGGRQRRPRELGPSGAACGDPGRKECRTARAPHRQRGCGWRGVSGGGTGPAGRTGQRGAA